MTTNEITTTLEAHLAETYENWNHNLDEGCYEYEREDGTMAFYCWDTDGEMTEALRNDGVEI